MKLLLVLVIFVLSAMPSQAIDPLKDLFSGGHKVVARGVGFQITRSELDEAIRIYLMNAAAEGNVIPPEEKLLERNLLDDLVVTRLLIKRAESTEVVTFREAFGTLSNSRVANIELCEGDQVMLCSPGGGGYGEPRRRAVENVLTDVREGMVSKQSAHSIYGVEIRNHPDGGLYVDDDTTRTLRQELETPDPKTLPSQSTELPTIDTSYVPQGQWHELDGDWWDTGIVNCQLCGQVIPRTVWHADDGGRFCSKACDQLHHGYVLPRQAAKEN